MKSNLQKTRWTVFAHGSVGDEILDILATRDEEAIAAVVTIEDRSSELSRLFKNAIFLTWEDVQKTDDFKKIMGVSEIVLLAWWPYILRGRMLELGQQAMLNLHPSLLPHCQGKDPNFWCLVEDRPAGVTIHHVDSTIDTGDIAFQREVSTSWIDTGESVYRKSQIAIVDLFDSVFSRIASLDIPHIKQDLAQGSFHRRSEIDSKSSLDIDRAYTARALLNVLRARTFEGHPACRFFDKGEEFEVTVRIRRKNERC